jgi:hypothetical protein
MHAATHFIKIQIDHATAGFSSDTGNQEKRTEKYLGRHILKLQELLLTENCSGKAFKRFNEKS